MGHLTEKLRFYIHLQPFAEIMAVARIFIELGNKNKIQGRQLACALLPPRYALSPQKLHR